MAARTVAANTSATFVCFAAQDWWCHSQSHSDFQLMRNVAADRPVLVVNSLGMRMPMPGRSSHALRRIGRKLRSMARYFRTPLPELPNFHVLTPLSLPIYGDTAWGRFNARLVAWQVRGISRLIGIRDPVCVVTIPTAEPVLRYLDVRSVVFNRADKLSLFEEADGSHMASIENRMLERADLVLYASHALMEEDAALVGKRGVFLGHGVDLGHFRRRPPGEFPADLLAIPRPRIGFFGTLDDLVDYSLIRRVAVDLPHANVVLVGPVSADLSGLDGLPNVYSLGRRPYETIPAYGSGFDVAIMPWVESEWIRLCNPIKLKEYLALGLPVISTYFPELEHFKGLVAVARSHEDFVAAIRQVLARADDVSADPKRCAEFTSKTWSSLADSFLELVG
jgi:glycosyltransferase involved in cell wall biosynthesis